MQDRTSHIPADRRGGAERRLALVTGGGSGIGRALAIELAASGYRVIICGRRHASLEETARSSGAGIHIVACDLATLAGRAKLVAAVRDTGRALDLLVNNAAVQHAWDLPRDASGADAAARIDAELGVNLVAPIQLTAALLPLLRHPGGVVLNMTSLLALHPKASAPVYGASKAGLRSFTRALRHQLAPEGISVIEAVPPLVDTAMTVGRGRGKISTEQAARELMQGLARRRSEIRIGKARAMFVLHRMAPSLAARLLIGG